MGEGSKKHGGPKKDDEPKKLLSKPVRRILEGYRVERPKHFRMKDFDPADTAGLGPQDVDENALARGVARLAELQAKLNAEDRWAVLLVFQAMDAAGKDSTIDHVMSGVNPAGCQVFSFKTPSTEELDHDFLWRHVRCLPERGRFGIFNRSWYEEVLVVKVHRKVLERQKVPKSLVTKDIWEERYEDINAFERHLSRNGTLVLKFFLHVSKSEQRRRFLARIDEPSKNWKFSLADVAERERWDDYMDAYEKMIRRTSTPHAPWHVIPADNKWFTRLAVAATIVTAVEALDPKFPEFDDGRKAELEEARRRLLREHGKR
jgi:PPK2 family polyphosphate:nucleotide phosphotransferase